MEFVCPFCKSNNIQCLSIVYEGGLSGINTNSTGSAIGFGSGGVSAGFGGSKMTGISQTVVSQKAAPPAKKRYLKSLLMISGVFMVLTMYFDGHVYVAKLFGVGWYAAMAAYIYKTYQYNTKKWPQLKTTWDNSYLCSRCNEISYRA